MTEKKKVVVNINSQEYTVVSVELEAYIKKIAKSVDEDIKEILDKNKRLSNTMAAVLAAFNVTDKYYKKSEKLDEIKENVLEPLKELETVKSKVREYEAREEKVEMKYQSMIKTVEDKKNEEIKTLTDENKSMKDQIKDFKRQLETLNKKNDRNENAIEIKSNDLADNQKTINDLQDKIFEYQMELMQTKKELEESLKQLDEK